MNKLLLPFFITLLLTSIRNSYGQSLDTKFGAKEGNEFNNTSAIQKAIDKCSIKREVLFWSRREILYRTILLKSNVRLSLMKGAELIGTKITLIKDGVKADRQAIDFKQLIQPIKAGETININMANDGGWAARIEPAD
jgi:polygalacturonase